MWDGFAAKNTLRNISFKFKLICNYLEMKVGPDSINLEYLIQQWQFRINSRRSIRSAFGRSTGKDISCHYFPHYYYFSTPLSSTFLKKGVLGSKNLFMKVDRNIQNPRHLSIPCRPFWGPLVAIFNFAGVAAFQGVSERSLASLGWY